MGINLYDTHTMLRVQEVTKPKATFLRDRFFPTAAEDIFATTDVLVDYKDETGRRLAPVVLPGKGGIPVAREGYETHSMEPPLVAPERPLTAAELQKRQFGEALFSGISPQEREARILQRDLSDLSELIDNREEYMAAQTLLFGAYTLRQYADKYGSEEYVEKTLKFYNESANPAEYACDPWSTSSTSILSDIAAMADILAKRGLPATDLVVSGDVADVILANEQILKLLDNRRYVLTEQVSPEEQASGGVLLCTLNVKGRMIRIYSYTREYVDEVTEKPVPFIPSGYVFLTAPAMGRTAYGAVTQLEQTTMDFATYAAKRVPHVVSDPHGGVRTLILQSRPLVLPKVRCSSISAHVLAA